MIILKLVKPSFWNCLVKVWTKNIFLNAWWQQVCVAYTSSFFMSNNFLFLSYGQRVECCLMWQKIRSPHASVWLLLILSKVSGFHTFHLLLRNLKKNEINVLLLFRDRFIGSDTARVTFTRHPLTLVCKLVKHFCLIWRPITLCKTFLTVDC